jgi:DNA segregation ATPase FtsK/SpoIIIE, S-DNA-T family
VPPARWPVGRWAARWPVIARPAERSYAASVVGLAGAWLSAATAWGPGTPPLPTVAILGTLAAGLPWWVDRRRRARVRVARIIDRWPTFADSIGLPGSRVLSAVVDRWGWSARLALRRGQTAQQVVIAAGAIESALAVRPGGVRVEPEPHRADRAVLRVVDIDPHAQPIPWQAPAAARSVTDPVELGVFEDGSPVQVKLLHRNLLLGGIIGSGKSGVANVLLAALVNCPDVVVWGIDLKGGMELQPWAGCLDRLATTPDDAVTLLRDALTEYDGRTRRLATAGQRLWQPTPTDPALIILVDEYAELSDPAKTLADSLARRGRATAVNLLIATQRPTQKAMGQGAVRQQMDVRICLRVRERRDVELILDQGMWAAGWHADALDAPGKFLLSDPEHTTPRRARAYLITDRDVQRTAARYAPHRPHISSPTTAVPGAEPSPDPADPGGDASRPAADPPADTDAVLWRVLCDATDNGVTVAELVEVTGLSRATVYRRLRGHAKAGRAVNVGGGRWRSLIVPAAIHRSHEP